jgi:uncharacterized Zn finger protein
MQVCVRNIVAACDRCGHQEFDELVQADRSIQAVLRCAKCGAFTTRLRLLMQIADQAVQNSKDFLERFRESQKHKDRQRKK